jgi:hypothetical protein
MWAYFIKEKHHMNAHSNALTAIAGTSSVLMIAVFVTISARLPWTTDRSRYEPRPEIHGNTTGDVAVPLQPDPSSALVDIRAHVQHHLGHHTEVPGSFAGTHQWSGEWHLQWLDVEHADEVLRIYHATAVRDPQHRFITIWTDDVAEWEHVR